jgi:hypothetical protein
MKKIINISLILLFTMTFIACEKERIMPVQFDYQSEQENGDCGFDNFENGIKGSSDGNISSDFDSVTDPDEDDDFDGEDELDTVTDPDEDEDFDGEGKENDNVTDPDEDDDFDGDEANGNNH